MGLRDIIKIKADTEVPASKGTVNLTVRLLLRCRTIDSGLTHYIKHLTDIDGYADSMSLGEPLNKGHLRPCQLSTPKYDLQLATRS